jgi:hypothetical protein
MPPGNDDMTRSEIHHGRNMIAGGHDGVLIDVHWILRCIARDKILATERWVVQDDAVSEP